jgi:hypothetical protein
MIGRYLLVLAGAFVITSGLLYFMQSVAVRMTGGDNTLYYLVNDFIPAPDRGRQRPVAPPVPEVAPARPAVSPRDQEAGVVPESMPDTNDGSDGLRIEPWQAPAAVPE